MVPHDVLRTLCRRYSVLYFTVQLLYDTESKDTKCDPSVLQNLKELKQLAEQMSNKLSELKSLLIQ